MDVLYFVDMQSSIARYFCYHKIDMFFVSLKTRYDINLVAIATYQVACNISSLLRHIENLARDLYRCIALQCNSSYQVKSKNHCITPVISIPFVLKYSTDFSSYTVVK